MNKQTSQLKNHVSEQESRNMSDSDPQARSGRANACSESWFAFLISSVPSLLFFVVPTTFGLHSGLSYIVHEP